MRAGFLGNILAAMVMAGAPDPTATVHHPRADAADPVQTSATKNVAYLGHSFTVPASWPVIQLTAGSSSCVLFNRHAVYLGSPPADQRCPAKTIGRTDALLIQPTRGAVTGHATDDPSSHQLDTQAPGIAATATYSSNPTEIRNILGSAGLPLPPAAAPRTVSAPRSDTRPADATALADSTNFTGLGIDPCSAPSASAMSAWRSGSPYGAVGIYIGGANMGCSQPNLTPGWVAAQAAAGWRFFLLYVGLQAPGSSCTSCSTITSAVAQGASAAQDAATNAARLGFGAGAPIIYDMEAYSSSGAAVALAFMSSWTAELHALGYSSGEYSSLSSGISDLIDNTSGYTMPDVIDIAAWNGDAITDLPAIPSADWANHQRIHQYSGEVDQTFDGYTINVDQDYLDTQGTFNEPVGGVLGDLTGDGRPDVVAIASNGDLLLYPNTGGIGTNTFGAASRIGVGWNGYTIAAVTSLYGSGRAGILAVAPDGSLSYYPNTGGTGSATFGPPTRVGVGWTGHTVMSVTDLYTEGRPGILAVAPDGSLSYYPNTGSTGSATFGPPAQVGGGWNGWTADAADINGDGRPDLLAVNRAGTLYLYPNTGGALTSTFGAPLQVGGGWNGWRAIDTGTLSGSSPAEILGVDSTGTMYEFPNTTTGATVTFGRREQVGSGWIGYLLN